MATSSNKGKSAPANNGDDPADIKLIAGVGAFVVVCFLVGYFVVGKQPGNTGGASNTPNAVTVAPNVVASNTQNPAKGTLTVVDNTAVMEAKRKKAEEDANKKAEEEAAKKAEDDAKKLAEEEAKENTVSPSPTASATPDADDLPEKSPVPSLTPDEGEPEPEATPTPKPTPTPTPKPTPTPTPVPSTPDDPEDRAMTPPSPSVAILGVLYRVRVGQFEDKANAEARAAELKSSGYDTSIVPDTVDGKRVYRLQVAAYRSEKAAREFAKEVEAKGFKTTVSRN